MENHPYIGIAATFFFAALIALAMIALASLLGPKRSTPVKSIPYEAGQDPFLLPAKMRIPVHFYVVAMVFVIFDVEIAFLFPWAVLFRELGWTGFFEISFFIFFILLAFACVWRNRVLEVE